MPVFRRVVGTAKHVKHLLGDDETSCQVDSGTVFDNMPPQIKPGFLGQAREFSNLIDGKLPTVGANMTDAYNAQVIAEQILGNHKP